MVTFGTIKNTEAVFKISCSKYKHRYNYSLMRTVDFFKQDLVGIGFLGLLIRCLLFLKCFSDEVDQFNNLNYTETLLALASTFVKAKQRTLFTIFIFL